MKIPPGQRSRGKDFLDSWKWQGTESPPGSRDLKNGRELKRLPAGDRGERIFSVLGNGRELKSLPAVDRGERIFSVLGNGRELKSLPIGDRGERIFSVPSNGMELKWRAKKASLRSGTEDAEIRASSVPSLYKSGWSEASPQRGLRRVAGRPGRPALCAGPDGAEAGTKSAELPPHGG